MTFMLAQVAVLPLTPSSSASAAVSASSVASGSKTVMPVAENVSVADLASIVKPFTADALANGFATLVGALLGAMLAYLLQRRFQRSLEFKSDMVSAHRLMFVLLQQINTIVLIQRDYVFGELGNPGRFISIPATPPLDMRKNVLELPELAFLLGTTEGRSILHDFYLAQENYIEALNQWNLRSALHLEKIQPVLAASGIPNGSLVTDAVVQKAFGAYLYGSIVNSTNNTIESLRRAFEQLAAVKAKTRPYLVKRFGTNDFTDFDFPDTYGLSERSGTEGA
ncbi:hypothetical protein HK414_08145 [Ramlibacter terrae]|uniref:DUF4760 domain-containing protein n=1 Tax=Ramlibacter terrae TaxID=2732511 RepID=A0ABX6P2K0_9BURK|nr:hypothetical protein HK414_08145 [Ramlibacter terrae]